MDETTPVVSVLDGFRLAVGTRERRLGPSLERLVAFLAVHPWPSRYVIADLLWPDSPGEAGLAALRTATWRLQKQEPGLIDATNRTLALAPHVRVDLHELLAWGHRVLRDPAALTDAELLPPETGAELLPGWYDDWLEPERQRAHQLRVHALETAAGEQCSRGRTGPALVAALAALQADPLRESTHRVLVRIHLADGNVAAALEQFDRCRRVLHDAVGVAPGAELTALVAPYRRG